MVVGAKKYYGAPPKTIVLKFAFLRSIESDPDKLVRMVAETRRKSFLGKL
jgi:hypothetical protein